MCAKASAKGELVCRRHTARQILLQQVFAPAFNMLLLCAMRCTVLMPCKNFAAQDAGCVEVDEESGPSSVRTQMMGRVASFYYLKHATMAHLSRALRPGMPIPEVGLWLCPFIGRRSRVIALQIERCGCNVALWHSVKMHVPLKLAGTLRCRAAAIHRLCSWTQIHILVTGMWPNCLQWDSVLMRSFT